MSQQHEARAGMITSLFGAVSRELHQFILSATGSSQSTEASTSSSQHSTPVKRKRRVSNVTYESDLEQRPYKRARTRSPEYLQRKNTSEERQYLDKADARFVDAYDSTSSEDTPSPTPVRKRRATSLMPGTLYEPSPTPEPETREERRVRFASDSSPTGYDTVVQPVPQHVDRRISAAGRGKSTPKLVMYDDLSSVTSPPSTADSDDVSVSQDSRSSIPRIPEGPLRSNSHTTSFNAYNSAVPKTYETSQTSLLSREGSFSFASSSERSFEQERIRELEREVWKLKEELARQSTTTGPVPPPPPPPPPPPSGFRGSQAKHEVQPSHDGPTRGSSSVLTNARAALKSAPQLDGKAVNVSANMRSTVPAVQMAAFLKEMKTVRLRKVASGPTLRELGSSLQSRAATIEDATFNRHRERALPSQSSISTISIGSSFNATESSQQNAPQTFATHQFPPARVTRNTEPTPSLCSDTGELADEERPPSTPPSAIHPPSEDTKAQETGKISSNTAQPGGTVQKPRSRPTEAVFDSKTSSYDERTRHVSRRSVFPGRPATSELLPSLSPERPRAPGRRVRPSLQKASRASTSRVIQTSSDEDEEDPLSMSAFDPVYQARAGLTPPASHKASSTRAGSHSHSRGATQATSTGGSVPSLEAELKRVIRAEVEREIEAEMREINRGAERILSGRGQKSNDTAGFLSGGGGAGPAVWIHNDLGHGKSKKTL